MTKIIKEKYGKCDIQKISRKQLLKYWNKLDKIEEDFYANINKLEKEMQKETNINDLEFFWCDNSIVGIGNESRTMKLIPR